MSSWAKIFAIICALKDHTAHCKSTQYISNYKKKNKSKMHAIYLLLNQKQFCNYCMNIALVNNITSESFYSMPLN